MANKLRFDKRNEGWRVVNDVGFNPVIITVHYIEFVPLQRLLNGNEPSALRGETAVERARRLPQRNLGQCHAEWLLYHQHQISTKFQRRSRLVFTGTVWCEPNGDRCVPYLDWFGDTWNLYWFPLHKSLSDSDFLVRFYK